ncbi:MAG: glycosyltransferase [Candidatus Daviesbacteria bacterium]|nr:glycosyltransferase [Candidatus Daviesbacteria bacterium]
MKYPKVSIIIPLYVIVDRFFDDLKKYEQLKYKDYEILIVSDKKINLDIPNAKLILTGKKNTGPAEKRDLALKYATGSICAFIDDDAYPDANWLKNAVESFKDNSIAAVGGPGLTPPEDGFWEQITGLTYQSRFCGGSIQHRFIKSEKRLVTDYPAYNLLVRTDVLKEVGGYGSHFYGGEDTFLCLKIINHNWKILYDPEVVVFHHRRSIFSGYLSQIANIGMHRGFFAKKYPETSRYFTYFAPSILTFGFILGLLLSLIFLPIRVIFFSLLGFFYIAAVLSILLKSNVLMASLAAIEIILTHLSYGVFFIKGLLLKKLVR